MDHTTIDRMADAYRRDRSAWVSRGVYVTLLLSMLLPFLPASSLGSSTPSVTPEFYAGATNRTCAEFAGPGQTWTELKIEPPASGTFTLGALSVRIFNRTDKSFDWTSNVGVDAVYVKAGAEGSNLYRYDPPAESTGDEGLRSPGDTGNEISHISFCFDQEPGVEIVKAGPTQAHEGDQVTYTFAVTNIGDFDLTNVVVTDDVLGAIGTVGTLVVGATAELTKITSAPADDVTNVATVCGSAVSKVVCDDDDHDLDVIHPSIEVVKTGTDAAREGDAVTYSFEVTNTGDVGLTDVAVTDDVLGAIGTVGDLAVGGSAVLTKASTAPADDVTNVASACGSDPLGLVVCDDDDHDLDVIHPGIEIVKTGANLAHPGDEVTYTFLVTNTGDVALTDVSVTDDVLGAIGTIGDLGVGASATLERLAVAPAHDVTNVATACGLDPISQPVCDDDDHDLDVIHPDIEVLKSAAAQARPGDEVTYTFAVTNTGDVGLTDVAVSDDVLGAVGTIPALPAGGTHALTLTTAAPSEDVTNVAIVCGSDPLELVVCDDDDHDLDVIHPGIDVVKSGAELAHAGDEVTYSFEVKNTGDVDLMNVVVSDDVLGAVGMLLVLPAGGTTTLSKSAVVTRDTTNTVVVCGVDLLANVLCDSDKHTVDVISPAIRLDKTVNGADHATVADALRVHDGDEVAYAVVITNTGDTPLTLTALEDSAYDITHACDGGVDDVLGVGESVTCTYASAIVDDVTNVAAVEAVDVLGGPKGSVSASDQSVVDAIAPGIEIVKEGPAFAHEGDEVTYSFTVTNTGDVDLVDVQVTDDVVGTIGTIELLGAGASETLEATFAIPSGDDVTNVGTACGADPLEAQVCDDDDHTTDVISPALSIVKTADPPGGPPRDVTYTYVVTNTGDVTLTDVAVTDDILGSIGPVGRLEPGQDSTLTRTVAVDAASPVTNIGTATGLDPTGLEVEATDDATISVVLGTSLTRLPKTGSSATRMGFLLAAMALWAGAVLILGQDRLAARSRRS